MIKIINVPSLYSALYEAVEFCKLNSKDKVEIIVPDKLSLFMEKFLFEKLNLKASFNIKVSTLNRFAKKSCIVDKEKQISKVGSLLLIHKILNENINNLKVLRSKAYSFAYAEDIFKTIGQLKASKIMPQEMETFSSEDKQLENKILDLALVYSEYENQKAGLMDASDMFLMSSLFVGKDRAGDKILFVGFDDFTAIEYSIIEQLAINAEVNILNCFSKGNNKSIYNHEIESQLRNIAYINEINIEVENKESNTKELKAFLESDLFAIKHNNFLLKDMNLKLFAGNNVASEIEFVARDIKQRIIDGNRFSAFGVAIFDLESNQNRIKEIFSKYEINYYLDSEISLNKSIFYKFLCSILKYNFESYNLSHLIDVINSPFFVYDENEKLKLINRLISINFIGRLKNSVNLGVELEEIKTALINFLSAFEIDENNSVLEVVEKLKQADEHFAFENILNNLANNNADLQNKILLTKSRETIFNLLDEVLKFNSSIDVHAFMDIFFHVADVVKLNNLPLTLDAVKVVEANNQIEIFDNLYVVNCCLEKAPSLKHDCGIIVDSEIDRLNFSHKLAPSIAHINRLSKLRLFNLVNMFEENLTITYSNNASEVIKEMQAKIQVELPTGITKIFALKNLNFGKYKALSKWDYIDYLCKNDKNNLKISENIVKNKQNVEISEENLNIYNNLNTISASYLESYFKCPFSSFLRYGLKVKPRIESEILSFDIGNVLHEIMFMYYKKKKQVGDIYEFCRDQVFAYVSKDDRLKINVKSPILTNLIDEAVRVINGVNYIDENSNFAPIMFEHGFANEKALQLKNINVIGKVDRVDKFNDMLRIVDYKSGKANASLKELYYGEKLQLFLYACAMENEFKNKVVGTFYLPLHNEYTREIGNTYALNGFFINEDFIIKAFDKRLEPNVKSDIVNVRMAKDGKARRYKGKELESDEMLALKNYSKQVASQAVDEIKSGYIQPSPTGVSDPCKYCEYAHVCMRKTNAIKSRNVQEVNLTSFKEGSDE